MMLLIDAHLPPSLAVWIKETFSIGAFSFDYMGWRTTEDEEVFLNAKSINESIIITKDEDFVFILSKHKSPPKVIWITSGNTSNVSLRKMLKAQLSVAINLLQENDLVEIK